MKTSYRHIVTFINAAHPWLEKHPGQGKFRYALTKVVKQGTKHWEAYTELLQDLDIRHCSVDKHDNIIKDDKGQLSFTKDAALKRNAERRVLFEAEDVEIAPYFSPHIPDDLTEMERQAFTGFVLPELVEEDSDDTEKLRLVQA